MSSADNRPVVRKAVIPAAGMGTRFLPASKAIPKEMLTVVDKPVIQYAVEECIASGIDHVHSGDAEVVPALVPDIRPMLGTMEPHTQR